MHNRWTYWLCQLLGWFGMVTIETINYTFFIAGKFSPALLWTFVQYAFAGICCTHVYRLILKRLNFFQQKITRIWPVALFSTILMAAAISMLSFGPAMIKDAGNFFKQIRFVDIAGTIINWMRYLGVWVIIYFMYKILQQNNAIKQEKLLVENLAKTTELELLKMQLNPHFLFNALNSIKALVIINPEQSRDAIVKLSELLRFTLQYGKQRWIPLNEEMQEVKKYLELEELRFGSRLQVTYNIDPGTLSQPIPPAIVLTLAENAVKHGVAKQPEEHTIQFTTLVSGDFLLVQVTNTGYYYNEQSGATGLGLKHIVKRLEEIYHNKAIFTVGNEDGRVMARMQTPLSWQ